MMYRSSVSVFSVLTRSALFQVGRAFAGFDESSEFLARYWNKYRHSAQPSCVHTITNGQVAINRRYFLRHVSTVGFRSWAHTT